MATDERKNGGEAREKEGNVGTHVVGRLKRRITARFMRFFLRIPRIPTRADCMQTVRAPKNVLSSFPKIATSVRA